MAKKNIHSLNPSSNKSVIPPEAARKIRWQLLATVLVGILLSLLVSWLTIGYIEKNTRSQTIKMAKREHDLLALNISNTLAAVRSVAALI